MKTIKDINLFKNDFLESNLSLSDEELQIDKQISTKFMKQIYRNIIENKNLLVIGDYDVDGFFSGIELSSYLKLLEKRVKGNLNTKIDTFYNKRQYGYEIPKKIFEEFSNKYDLIIFLDTGATYSYLDKNTKNVLVIDHHPNKNVDLEYIYNPNKNNSISTSTGRIVYEMIEDFENNMRNFFGKDKIKSHDLMKVLKIYAGITLCSDMAKMSYNNKIFLEQSLKLMSDNKKHLTFLKNIPSRNITSMDISFNLINEINAYSRMNKDLKDLEDLYKYDMDNKNLLSPLSTKEQISILNTLKSNNDTKKEMMSRLEQNIITQLKDINLEKQDVLAIKLENPYVGLNGLLSQNILGMHLKSNIVISFDKERNEYVGSGRGNLVKESLQKLVLDNPELNDSIAFGGHEMAVGLSIKEETVDIFMDKYNSLKIENNKVNNFDIYRANIKEFKQSIEDYSILSPTTLIDSKFYVLLEDYNVLNEKFIKKNNWLTTTLIDDTGILTIYFDDKIKDKLINKEPIVLEITNNQGTQFVKNIEFLKDHSIDLVNENKIENQEFENFIKYNFN